MDKYFRLYKCTFSALSAAERFIFSYIEYFSRNGDTCLISQARLAEKLNISSAMVKYAVSRLAKIGLVTITANNAGKHKTINTYTVNREKFKELREQWHGVTESEPETVRVGADVLRVFGATKEAILFSVMETLTDISTKAGESENFAERANYLNCGQVLYGQRALAAMCGCSARYVRTTFSEWAKQGLLEVEPIPMNWQPSRNAYTLTASLADFARVKKVSIQNDEEEKIIPSKNEEEKIIPSKSDEEEKIIPSNGDEEEKIIPNDNIYSDSIISSSENSLQAGVSDPRVLQPRESVTPIVENSFPAIETADLNSDASTDSEQPSQRKKRKFAWADEMQGVSADSILTEYRLKRDTRAIDSWGSV